MNEFDITESVTGFKNVFTSLFSIFNSIKINVGGSVVTLAEILLAAVMLFLCFQLHKSLASRGGSLGGALGD